MTPDDLLEFEDHVKDIKGYLTALIVNYIDMEEKLAPYLEFLSYVGKREIDPVDFFECITELHSLLGVLITVYPKVENEIFPCVKVLDDLRGMFRA